MSQGGSERYGGRERERVTERVGGRKGDRERVKRERERESAVSHNNIFRTTVAPPPTKTHH